MTFTLVTWITWHLHPKLQSSLQLCRNSTLAAQVKWESSISQSIVRLPLLWVWFRKSLVDPAPWWLCHDAVGSSQQLDQAKQASGYAYNVLHPHCHLQKYGSCRVQWPSLCVFVATVFCVTVCFTSETPLRCTDWQLNPGGFYTLV